VRRNSKSVSIGPDATPLKFALVTTGGTIAGLKTGASHYQSAELKGQALADRLGLTGLGESGVVSGMGFGSLSEVGSDVQSLISWEVHSPYAIGSQNLTWSEMFTLRELLIQLNADDSVHGVLVTHGTDTMEDMLFFLSLTLPELRKPIVFTGSILTSDSPNSDAQSNVADSVRLLLATAVNAEGIASSSNLVKLKNESALFGLVMNGKFTPASEVQKRSTSGVDAFDNLGNYSATYNINDLVTYLIEGGEFPNLTHLTSPSSRSSDAKLTLPTYTVAQFIEHLQRFTLEVVYCTPNMLEGSIRSRVESSSLNGSSLSTNNTRITLIIAAPGNGNIPSRFIPELRELMRQGVRVVRASRISQSPLRKGGELTGLEELVEQLVIASAQCTDSGSMDSNDMLGSGIYHEAHGLSLNQIVVMETCRFLISNS
jgi:L-asparaginase